MGYAGLEIARFPLYALNMRFKPFLALAAVLSLSACATVDRYDAAGDVHDFLVAIRDNDRAGFDDHVDRQALKYAIEAKILSETRKAKVDDGWRAVASALSGAAAGFASDALIRPEVFRAAANYYGYTPDRPIPGRIAIASTLRPAGDGRVCAAKKSGPCLLTFTREGATWRLTGFDAEAVNLQFKR
ncbi:MAG: hypothetical protein JWP92_1834 [Caulobacter sp.]|nr:hypothetical protein [Caulobacter sp.]